MRKLAALAVTAVTAAGTFAVTTPARAAAQPPGPGTQWLVHAGVTKLSAVIKGAGADRADRDNPDDGDSATGVTLTGAGIGVAVLDSGVSPVPGLHGPGKVIHGPDLSFESQAANLRHLDTFGHGTHMAGIIAGQDTAGQNTAGTARFAGVAPGAHIVSVKVASADGATDVSQVIAGIDWIVAHRNDPGLNIKVLNLSYGTRSAQPAALDPLAYAVEQAWRAGIVVVAAAGNDGFAAERLTMPAADPDVIAVGATDPRGTDGRTDDAVADFSNRGNATRHADVLATGRSIVSLRSPGSYIDRTYPGARLSPQEDPEQRFLRGSGTSQAAAVVSGTVALLLQQRPGLRPDQVKKMLMSTADPIAGGDPYAAGAGQINLARAARTKSVTGPPQTNPAATGLGSLEAARGGAYVFDSVTGTPLTGERDIFGKTWNARTWAVAAGTRRSWIGGAWNGSTWAGSSWGTAATAGKAWSPATWTGRSWSGETWSGRSWSGATWTGRSWSAETWTGRSWSGRSWSSAGWTGEPWQ
jgi:serine protease AprX